MIPVESREPDPEVTSRMAVFDPPYREPVEPKIMWGVTYIASMLIGRRITRIDETARRG